MFEKLQDLGLALLAALIVESAPGIANGVLWLVTRLLPQPIRRRYYEDFRDDLSDKSGNLIKIVYALGFLGNVFEFWEIEGKPITLTRITSSMSPFIAMGGLLGAFSISAYDSIFPGIKSNNLIAIMTAIAWITISVLPLGLVKARITLKEMMEGGEKILAISLALVTLAQIPFILTLPYLISHTSKPEGLLEQLVMVTFLVFMMFSDFKNLRQPSKSRA